MTMESERLAACREAFRKWVEESGADFGLETEHDDMEPDCYYSDSRAADAFDGFRAAYGLYADEIDELQRKRDAVEAAWGSAEVKRHRKDADECRQFKQHGVFGMAVRNGESLSDAANRWYDEFHNTEQSRYREVVRLRNEIELLREVLVPFAAAAEHMTAGKACDPKELGIWSDDTSGCRVTVADFQRAAEAANPTPPDTPSGE